MHDVDGALGLPLHRGVDDAPSDTVHKEDADEGALVVYVCALGHHGQQVGVQALGRREKLLRTTVAHHGLHTTGSPGGGQTWSSLVWQSNRVSWLEELPV